MQNVFQMTICDTAGGKATDLLCTRLLRKIEGRRIVYEGTANGKPVIIKIFSSRLHGWRHFEREVRGFENLALRGIETAAILAKGHGKEGWALALEKIENAEDVFTLFDGLCEPREKKRILAAVFELLAKMHAVGVLQRDLHLGNFLWDGKTAFAMDPAKIRFSAKPVHCKNCLRQLAILSTAFTGFNRTEKEDLLDVYFRERGWQVDRAAMDRIESLAQKAKQRGIEHTRKKILRSSRHYIRQKSGPWRGYIHRDFNGFSPADLAGQTPPNTHRTVLTKVTSSDTARVWRYTVQARGRPCTLYLKEYLYRSRMDFVKHLCRPSRAERALKAGIILERYGLHTPDIAALLIKKKGLFVIENFLVTREMKQARALYTFFEDTAVTDSGIPLRSKRRLIIDLGKTIGRMHKAGIPHGDLRSGNIFVFRQSDCQQFIFIDNERTAKYPVLPFWLRNKNLVQLNMLQKNITRTDRMRFLRAYADTAGLSEYRTRRIAEAVMKKTRRRLKHRTATRIGISDASGNLHWDFRRARLDRRAGIFLTDFCHGDTAAELLRQIDTLMEAGTLLKDDITTRVVRCSFNNRDIVIKRYNYQGFWHSLRYTLKGSRAKKCWRFGHQLTDAHIPCAACLGLIEERAFGLVRQSYIVNEFIEGPLLYDVMNRPGYSPQEREAVMQKAEQLLKDMGRHRFTHADMKPANMIIRDGQPVLIDLDSMQQHRVPFYFRYRYRKMVNYFHNRLHGKKKK